MNRIASGLVLFFLIFALSNEGQSNPPGNRLSLSVTPDGATLFGHFLF